MNRLKPSKTLSDRTGRQVQTVASASRSGSTTTAAAIMVVWAVTQMGHGALDSPWLGQRWTTSMVVAHKTTKTHNRASVRDTRPVPN